ncbi:MAG: T9SS type A sorting domain-containing protein [Prevotella sp.]|nr:T9SS type A sorting domain-containing protein [Prevotella sp.]
MKNLLLLAILFLCSIGIHGEEYATFTFMKADGTEVTLPAVGLRITFNNGMITAVNGQDTETVSLADVNTMFFSNATAITKILSPDYAVNVSGHQLLITSPIGTDITVANTLGMVVCRSISTSDGEQTIGGSLPSGVYIVNLSGQTLKVMVR